MGEESRDALVENFVARAIAASDILDGNGPHGAARAVLKRLAAEDSPVLLVARGDVEERVEPRTADGTMCPVGRSAHGRPCEGPGTYYCDGELWGSRCRAYFRQSRTVRSWSLPDGSRVEVTEPWIEVDPA